LRCRNCGLICQDGSISYDQTQGGYDEEKPEWDVARFEELGHRFRQAPAAVLETVRRYRSGPCSLLDVGCYRGFLLRYFQMNGWTDLTGIEPSRSASAFGRERLKLDVRTGILGEYVADPSHRTFDVVVTTQVIEHTPDPAAFLGDLTKVMAPSAIAVIELPHFGQPNVWFKSFRSRLGLGNPPWRHLGFPKHIFNFTARSMRLLLERTGYEILAAAARSKIREHDGPVGRLVRQLKSAVGWGSTLQFVVRRFSRNTT
jgi:SAM-dependent methyltransferase